MAVGAPHLALLYLGPNSAPTAIPAYQVSNVVLLFASDMIELQHDRVCLTTVNAWMLL